MSAMVTCYQARTAKNSHCFFPAISAKDGVFTVRITADSSTTGDKRMDWLGLWTVLVAETVRTGMYQWSL
jgi:hypothetical protein